MWTYIALEDTDCIYSKMAEEEEDLQLQASLPRGGLLQEDIELSEGSGLAHHQMETCQAADDHWSTTDEAIDGNSEGGYRHFGGIYEASAGHQEDSKQTDGIEYDRFESNYNIYLHQKSDELNKISSTVRSNIIGNDHTIETPFGEKRLVYLDWTASGRGLRNIESFIVNKVLPVYGNTHTSTSLTGLQSSCFRHEARQIVAESVNAKTTGRAAIDVVIFTGNGSTAAFSKLISSLGLNQPLPDSYDDSYRPVVFISSYEHHSNMLPWREANVDVVTIDYCEKDGVKLIDLSQKLEMYADKRLKIGSFSAASNVTGILTNVDAVATLMHRAGGLAFFDYATAAPYVKINMNPVSEDGSNLAYKDAIIFSGHKFLGGPGAPGVLIIKKKILPPSTMHPTLVGGGTVFYVTEDHHRYLSNAEEREEGGTPYILGDIRMGLAMKLKQSIGSDRIELEELNVSNYVYSRISQMEGLKLLGRERGAGSKYLPIFSFLIRPHGYPRFLHYNFVTVLLNDLFGIQARGGCMCAGPFAHQLLGISSFSHQIENALLNKEEVLRPGFTRLSFPFWLQEDEIEYVLSAIEFICKNGVLFLPSYRYNHRTGEWAHLSRLTKFPTRIWISRFDVVSSSVVLPDSQSPAIHENSGTFQRQLEQARVEVAKLEKEFKKRKKSNSVDNLGAYEGLRWFILQSDEPNDKTDIQGPVNTDNFKTHRATLNPQILHAALADQTLYARKRARKLVAFNSNSSHDIISPPRYTNLDISPQPLACSIEKEKNVHLDNPLNTNATKSTSSVNMKNDSGVDGLDACKSGRKALFNNADNVFQPQSVESKKVKAIVPPKKLLRSVGQAIKDFDMIKDGDRLLLGLSGGKDSLALLHVLLNLQKKAPVKFTIAAATVDPQTDSFDPRPLIPYMKSIGVTYHFLSEPIVEMAKSKLQGDSLCAFCSRFKRGLLYSCCRENNYNKLVLAQHLDDLAESFLMSALHNGQIRTMKANYEIEAGDVRVIRPLIYTRESMTRDFSLSSNLPIINENCPACFEQPKERHRVKKLLAQEEAMIPALFANIRKALIPFMHNEIYPVLNRLADSTGKKNNASDEGEKMDEQFIEGRQQEQQQQCTSEYCPPCNEIY